MHKTTTPRVYVPAVEIERETKTIEATIPETTDVITFAGMVEPTLGANRSADAAR